MLLKEADEVLLLGRAGVLYAVLLQEATQLGHRLRRWIEARLKML